MEKLTLKHLASYLPYGLKIQFDDGIAEMVSQTIAFPAKFIDIETVCEDVNSSPILRPLSDFTKEIEQNGEKFIPLFELGKIFYPTGEIDCIQEKQLRIHIKSLNISIWLGYDTSSHSFCLNKGYVRKESLLNYMFVANQLEMFEKLFEWHFDVFHLINTELAINMNTLTIKK